MTLEIFLHAIGRKIALYRKNQSLRQREAASQAGISYRYYQNIETGKANITLSTLLKLAKTYQVHPCEFLPEKSEL